MPRLLKALGPPPVKKLVEDIPDNYLIIIEHSSLLYMIEKYGANKSKMNKALAFIALGVGWEYLVQYAIHGQQAVGADA